MFSPYLVVLFHIFVSVFPVPEVRQLAPRRESLAPLRGVLGFSREDTNGHFGKVGSLYSSPPFFSLGLTLDLCYTTTLSTTAMYDFFSVCSLVHRETRPTSPTPSRPLRTLETNRSDCPSKTLFSSPWVLDPQADCLRHTPPFSSLFHLVALGCWSSMKTLLLLPFSCPHYYPPHSCFPPSFTGFGRERRSRSAAKVQKAFYSPSILTARP